MVEIEIGSMGVQFDGVDDYIEVDDSISLSFTNAISIEAWFKLDTLQSGEKTIIRKNNQWQLGLFPQASTIRNLLKTDGVDGWTIANDETYQFEADTWYFATFTWDGSTLKHFINAIQVGDDKLVTGNIVDNTDDVAIGANTYGGAPTDLYLDGTIDEVRIYNRELSETEVEEHYTGLYRDETDLVLYLPLNGSFGDRSGYNNNGINHNGAFMSVLSDVNLTLERIVNWEDGRPVPIPIKRIYGKCSPTTQADCFTAGAKQRRVRCKLTFAQRDKLYRHKCCWLNWYEDGELTNKIWIDRIEMSYQRDADETYPWLATLYMYVVSCPIFPLVFPIYFCE